MHFYRRSLKDFLIVFLNGDESALASPAVSLGVRINSLGGLAADEIFERSPPDLIIEKPNREIGSLLLNSEPDPGSTGERIALHVIYEHGEARKGILTGNSLIGLVASAIYSQELVS